MQQLRSQEHLIAKPGQINCFNSFACECSCARKSPALPRPAEYGDFLSSSIAFTLLSSVSLFSFRKDRRFRISPWQSNSILELGQSADSGERSGDLEVVSGTLSKIAYVLIESSWRKFVLFDFGPKALVKLTFQCAAGISCEGQYLESKERFGGAAGVQVRDNISDEVKRKFSIRINGGNATIESPQVALSPASCCAPERPDYYHE